MCIFNLHSRACQIIHAFLPRGRFDVLAMLSAHVCIHMQKAKEQCAAKGSRHREDECRSSPHHEDAWLHAENANCNMHARREETTRQDKEEAQEWIRLFRARGFIGISSRRRGRAAAFLKIPGTYTSNPHVQRPHFDRFALQSQAGQAAELGR